MKLRFENMTFPYENFHSLFGPQDEDELKESRDLVTQLEALNGNFDGEILLTDIRDAKIRKSEFPLLGEMYEKLKEQVQEIEKELILLDANISMTSVSVTYLSTNYLQALTLERRLYLLGFDEAACEVGIYTMIYGSYLLEKTTQTQSVPEDLQKKLKEYDPKRGLEEAYQLQYADQPSCSVHGVAQAFLDGGREAEMEALRSVAPVLEVSLDIALWNQ